MTRNMIVSNVRHVPEAAALHPVQVPLILTLIPHQRCLTVSLHVSVTRKCEIPPHVYITMLQMGT